MIKIFGSGNNIATILYRHEVTLFVTLLFNEYTSGTTGKPKGAVISMANGCNLSWRWQDSFSLNQNDRVLLFSCLSFIMCLCQWVATLCAGATVVIPSNATDFESTIRDCGVNKLVSTPSALSCLDLNIAEGIDAVQVAGEPPQIKF
jgi:acyl-coenzyme A synthetase/AMP-(fatty) acid ligase